MNAPAAANPDPGTTRLPLRDRVADWAFALFVLALPWTIAPMGITAGVLAAATVPLWALPPRRGWVRSPMDWAAPLWAIALLLSAWFAVDRAASLPRVTKALFPLLVGLAALHARDRMRGGRAVALLFVSAMLAATFGLVVFLAQGASFDHRARGAVGHYMTFAGQLLLFLGPMLGVALYARTARWRVGALLAAVPALLALAGTFTRSAWLGLLGSLAVLFGAWRPRWLPVVALAATLVVVFSGGAFRARIFSVFDPHNLWNRERVFMWDAGVRMFHDHPVTGVGLMDLHAIYDQYRSPESTERAGHLHSVPVMIAATMGWVGIVAFAALTIALFWTALAGLPATLARGGLAAGVRLGVLAALVGFAIAGLFEWNLGDEELLYPLYTLAGLAWAARTWSDERAAAAPAPPARGGRA